MKRRALAILVLLVAGAALNVAVAWGCATWSPVRLTSMLVERPTAAQQEWWRTAASPGTRASDAVAIWRSKGVGCDAVLVLGDRSGKATFNVDPSGQTTLYFESGATTDRATVVRAGWPWRSLAGERWDLGIGIATPIPMFGQEVSVWRDADLHVASFSFDRPTRLGGSSMRMLPFRPVWGAFAADIAFYAIVLWGVYRGSITLRRHLRIKRGLCPGCAYPMGAGEHCTECGAELPGRIRTAT